MGIRAKLIIIFIFIKVLPLIALAWLAWHQLSVLMQEMDVSFERTTVQSLNMGEQIVELATKDSIKALDEKARESIERLAFDTAENVARFLYERDLDILQAALMEPTKENYEKFLGSKYSSVYQHGPYRLSPEGDQWLSENKTSFAEPVVQAGNDDNSKDFHSLPKRSKKLSTDIPLYLEMSFIDLNGNEKVKVTTSDLVDGRLRNVAQKENTFCKAENYFQQLRTLQAGKIYVSDVIGAYQKTHLIGPYTAKRTQKAGIDFAPQESAYAGKENPVGKRFQGLVRWGVPVERDGRKIGYVTLALDHNHLMNFTDHTVPTEERHTVISDASSGNYTFMWDYLGRNISHPRDYFITGYDPETGSPALPWLEAKHYQKWSDSNLPTESFLATLPLFEDQTLEKKPSREQTQSGYVGLDCRYLNFAPQCDGWMNLTQHGGSGSFLIFWSGLWKLTTAAAIPYYTGHYGESPRGFGFITIGANVDEFHKAAITTAAKIETMGNEYAQDLEQQNQQIKKFLQGSMNNTARTLTVSTLAMVILVIIIAIWMASVLTRKIMKINQGIRVFQQGDLGKRLDTTSGDELDELALAFNAMADNIEQSMTEIQDAYRQSEVANKQLLKEVKTRKQTEKILAEHRDNLEGLVSIRTSELEQEVLERKQALEHLKKTQIQLIQSEKLAGIGQLAAGVAHEINTPIQYIGDNVRFFKESFSDWEEHEKNCEQLLKDCDKADNKQLLEKYEQSKENADIDYLKEEMPQSFEQTLEGVERVSKIVLSIKNFSHPGEKEKTMVDINEAIKNTITVSRNVWKTVADIETKLSPELPAVYCLSGEINQVILNLVTNAAHAISDVVGSGGLEKGLIHIETRENKDKVEISISDSGKGIPEEIQSKIFEPFYTTKEVGQGTGQGLAISWSVIVDHHGGDIRFTTGEKGTTFYVELPQRSDCPPNKKTSG